MATRTEEITADELAEAILSLFPEPPKNYYLDIRDIDEKLEEMEIKCDVGELHYAMMTLFRKGVLTYVAEGNLPEINIRFAKHHPGDDCDPDHTLPGDDDPNMCHDLPGRD